MKNSKALKGILFLCAFILILPGAIALFSPEKFTARNGIDITGNLSLFNDYRGLGGILLGNGIIILLGVMYHRMAFTSNVVAVVIYLSFGLGRIFSIGMDGMPAKGLMVASIVEIALGLLAVFALIKFRE